MLGKLRELLGMGRKRDDLSRFRILGQTGKGSMSRVLRAFDTSRDTDVAIKILDPNKLAKLMQRQALNRPPEGEIASAFRHPYVVRTLEYGINTEGHQFLVMEFIKGVGLNYLIETRSEDIQGRRIDLCVQIARGMAHIHDCNFIHRDVCPRNIMVDENRTAKIIDFGLSVPDEAEFKKPGNRTGTAAYMAPELIRRTATDHRVDIFSFGVTMYEMMTGELPWPGQESLTVIVQHLNVDPTPPSELRPDMDPELEQIILRAIARKPDERYQHMREIAMALEKLDRRDY